MYLKIIFYVFQEKMSRKSGKKKAKEGEEGEAPAAASGTEETAGETQAEEG